MANDILRVAVLGEYDERNEHHRSTTDELVSGGARVVWIPTDTVGDPAERLSGFGAIFIAPASPFASMEGVLRAIRYAREARVPLIGTCGGYQHVVVEFVRNVLGISDADHAESNPDAEVLAVTPLVCSVAGQRHPVLVLPGTRAAAVYERERVVEPYYCNYGMNPTFESRIQDAGLRVSGRDEEGKARILELEGHPFFVATLYVFQMRDSRTQPHPLTSAFLAAARAASRGNSN